MSQPWCKGTAVGAVLCGGRHRLVWAAMRERKSEGEEGHEREGEARGRGISRRFGEEATSRRWSGRVPARCGHVLCLLAWVGRRQGGGGGLGRFCWATR